jgi:hypothetical protein
MNTNDEQESSTERRRAQRHSAQREAHLLFIASPLAVESEHPRHTLMGHTRDISETGLSLVVASTHVSDYDLCEVGRLLKIKLSLPSGVAEMDSEVVRSEWLDEDDPRKGYFLGVRITKIRDEDRGRFTEYLSAVGGVG